MAAGKIDLKARLGKKSVAPSPGVPPAGGAGQVPGSMGPAPGSMAPGSMAPGSRPSTHMGPGPQMQRPQGGPQPGPGMGLPSHAPSPQRPPAGASIPAPPGFGARPPTGQRPAPSAAPAQTAPVGAPPAVSAQPVRPQSIKIDMSDEVIQAQRAGRSKVKLLAAATAIVGAVLGYGIGSLVKGNEGAQAAVQGAGLLVGDISKANETATELNELLKAAAKKVKGGEFPADEVEKLGAIDIPFDGSNLMNKGIGRYNSTAMTMLLQYSTAVQNVEDQKDKVRRLLGSIKPYLDNLKAEKENPMFHWGVKLDKTPSGAVGTMTLIKPFPAKERWPSELEFGKTKLERYGWGDPKADSVVVPVDPGSETMVCPENIAFRVIGALMDTSKELEGDPTPGHERAGVIELGNKTMEQLKKIGSGAAS